MKETAVEWLSNELYEKFEMRGDGLLYDEILDQAKEMERQQIIDAYDNGNRSFFEKSGKKYYNETFEK